MAQRYDFGWRSHEAECSETGGFVKYEDYEALQKERNRIKAHLDALAYSVLNYPLSPDTEELAREVFER